MTSPNGDLGKEVYGLRLRQEDQIRRMDVMDKRLENSERVLNDLGVMRFQITKLESQADNIRASIDRIAKENEERQKWMESFRLQIAQYTEGKGQSIKAGYLTVIGLIVAFTSALVVGVLETVLRSGLGGH